MKNDYFDIVLPLIQNKRVLDIGSISHNFAKRGIYKTWNFDVFLKHTKYLMGIDIIEHDVKKAAEEGLKKIESAIHSGKYQIVIMDEINVAVSFGLLNLNNALRVIQERLDNVEIIATGRSAPKEFIKIADLVTEMKEVKHYYEKGIVARKGIEK